MTWRSAVAWCAAAALAGCEAPPQAGIYRPDLAPTMDRMIRAYPDLASKKFHVLADFEEPAQATLFRRVDGDRVEPMTITTERARRETGVGSLKLLIADSGQRVIASDRPDAAWALHRDWSRYHLLLFSVFSPREFGGFSFAVRSGEEMPLHYRHSRLLLKSGWNLVRIDLAEVGDQVNLTDVRELRFWCEPLDTPIELYLDDLILVDNTRRVFGQEDGETGDLYVSAKGRRLVVGAVGRFELVFARGRIVQWFDVDHDPGRLHNLVGIGYLGPTPVVMPEGVALPPDLDDEGRWSALGAAVETYQSLLDANPLQAVVQGEWRFGEPTGGGGPGPVHRWMYSVYADGRVYVSCVGTAKTAGFEPPGIGMLFACAGDQRFTRQMAEGLETRPAPPAGGSETYALFSRAEGLADLLIVPAKAGPGQAVPGGDRRSAVVWRLTGADDPFTFAALVRVWPTDIDSPRQAGAIATDYRRPLPLALDVGRLVRTDEGDLDNDGFSEARGYYLLQLEGNVAKVRVSGKTTLRFSPTFKVVDVADREVWVYVDGRQLRPTPRDRNGDLLFTVEGAVADEVLIEVVAGPKQPSR